MKGLDTLLERAEEARAEAESQRIAEKGKARAAELRRRDASHESMFYTLREVVRDTLGVEIEPGDLVIPLVTDDLRWEPHVVIEGVTLLLLDATKSPVLFAEAYCPEREHQSCYFYVGKAVKSLAQFGQILHDLKNHEHGDHFSPFIGSAVNIEIASNIFNMT